MRILIAHWNPGVIGGTEKYLQALIPALRRSGHEVAFLHGYRLPEMTEPIVSQAPKIKSWSLEQLGTAATLRNVSDWSPSVIYTHGWQSSDTENELLKHFPCVLFVHDYQWTCPTGRKSHSFPDMRPCERLAGPECLFQHYPRRCGGLNPLTMIRDYQRQSSQLERLSRYRAVLVASRHMRDELAQHGVPEEKLSLLRLFPPGFTPDASPPVKRTVRGNLLVTGRLVRLKGTDRVLKALPAAEKKLGRRVHLTIAGSGPEAASLCHLAASLTVDVKFAGWSNQEQLRSLMREADLLAVPSLWPEPFGLAGIEAGCLGVPSVAYSVGGIPDWLTPGQTGELAPGDPPTVSGLAEAIIRALADPSHYAQLALGAWNMAHRFNLETHVEHLGSILGMASSLDSLHAPSSSTVV